MAMSAADREFSIKKKKMPVKARKCLKCDKRIVTTTYWRLCPACRNLNSTYETDYSLMLKTVIEPENVSKP